MFKNVGHQAVVKPHPVLLVALELGLKDWVSNNFIESCLQLELWESIYFCPCSLFMVDKLGDQLVMFEGDQIGRLCSFGFDEIDALFVKDWFHIFDDDAVLGLHFSNRFP